MSLTKVSFSMISGAYANVLDFGADPTGINDSTSAIWSAIISLRANPVSILDTIGGNIITAYSSGVVYFPPGVYKVSPDSLKIYQDVGLQLLGTGSRRTNNAVRASTTLLISGTSSGFGIQAYRSGGRGLTIQDMDVCYETSAFTGSVLDVVDAPGVNATRAFFGTYIPSTGTRLQTAAACVRSTYDEFLSFFNCVFDGANRGWWSDDTRTELGNPFGGSVTKFDSCVFYDFTENQVYHGGTRTRFDVTFVNCAFNPISVSPSSTCLNMDNVEGINVNGCGFGASVSSAPAVQWVRLTNVTGQFSGNTIDDLAPAGQLSGMLNFSGNRLFCTNGFALKGGVISGKSNEFSKGTSGLILDPAAQLSVSLGPDLFKPDVTYSYDIPADSAFLSGKIYYDKNNDGSTSKFRNLSGRIGIQSSYGGSSISSATYSVPIVETGNIIIAVGTSNQTFTLPTPVPGTALSFSKVSSVDLTINCAGGTNFYGQGSSFPTSAKLTGSDMGGLMLEAYGTIGWIVKSEVNTWTYS